MMPPGAQIIQVQSHPHGQPVQLVQRFPGRVLPNGQIIHQMPFAPVLTAAHQHQPPIQLQHHPMDLQDRQGATLTAGPTLVQFHNDPHPHLTSTHFDDHHHRTNLSSTDEQLLRLSNSSVSSHVHPSLIAHSLPSGLLPMPNATATTTDEHSKSTNYPRRPNRFEQREEPSTVVVQETHSNYSDFHGAPRHSFNDRSNPRGRGHPSGNRGYFNNNNNNGDRSGRSDYNDNDNGGYRNRGGFNRGARAAAAVSGGGNSHQSRFNSRPSNQRSNPYEHSSNRRSSRSPDRHGSSYRSSSRHSDRSLSINDEMSEN